jgi:flavin reductase (DIM6/NTAB) family NADH-FMN oxidoreductase RutF
MVNEASRALAQIDREVWVITSQTKDGRRGGLVATWLQQTSLDDARPSILIAIHPNHYTRELIDSSGAFCGHLLRTNQVALAAHFARSSGRDTDKLADCDLETTQSGMPRLRSCLAWTESRVSSRLVTADRIYYWAECINGATESTSCPLRESAFYRALSADDLAVLRENRRQDTASLGGLADAWQTNLPDILRFSPTD